MWDPLEVEVVTGVHTVCRCSQSCGVEPIMQLLLLLLPLAAGVQDTQKNGQDS